MAVLYVRPASDIQFSTEGGFGMRKIAHSYVVKSNVTNESKATILGCGLLPVFGYSPHPQDLAAICTKVDLQQKTEGSQFWEAKCEWSTFTGGKDPQNQQKDPPDRRPVWSYSFQPITKYYPCDLDGTAFVDAAGTPFDPPPERPIWIDEITIKRFETSVNRKSDRKYLNACNQDAWQDAAPGEALIHNIATEEVFEFGQYWFHRTFTVLVNPRIVVAGTLIGGGQPFVGAWDYECILNQGPKYIPNQGPNAGKPTPIVASGIIDGRPQRLDANGNILAPGAQNVYLKFRLKNKTAFGPLNLKPPY